MGVESRYHHGNLRQQVLSEAAAMVADRGPAALSMRDLARRAGVSHAAPAHHFGDRRGLLTALAVEGFEQLADALRPSAEASRFDRMAVAYVRFASAHPGHFAVMFRADLVDGQSTELHRAQARATELLDSGVRSLPARELVGSRLEAARSAWALVHGIASLHLSGMLPGTDLDHLTLTAAHQLFGEYDE